MKRKGTCYFPSILWDDENDARRLFRSLCRLECGMEYIIVPLGNMSAREGERLLRGVMRQSYVVYEKKHIYLFEDIRVDAMLNAVLIKPSAVFSTYIESLPLAEPDKVDLKLLAKCVMREGK